MPVNYGQRAAAALDELLPHTDRAKRVQRLFDCSARMAAYLLSGESWTARHLTQASELLGDAFDAALVKPENQFKRHIETLDIDARLARSEQDIEQIRRRLDAAMAPLPSPSPPVESRSSGAGDKQTSSAATDSCQDDGPQ